MKAQEEVKARKPDWYELIPKSADEKCEALRDRLARRLRSAGVLLAPDYKTFDILAFSRLPGVKERLTNLVG